VDGDELLYIIASSRLAAGKLQGPVVGTLMTNLGLEHALSVLGVELMRAKVGDRYVMEVLESSGGLLGGEGSGHIICLDRTTTGDGIISALQVLAEMWRSGKSLHELRQGMHKYPQVLHNVRVKEKPHDLDEIESLCRARQAVENKLNGNGRVLLRSSGTESLIRVMIEGQNEALIEQLAQELAEEVQRSLS